MILTTTEFCTDVAVAAVAVAGVQGSREGFFFGINQAGERG